MFCLGVLGAVQARYFVIVAASLELAARRAPRSPVSGCFGELRARHSARFKLAVLRRFRRALSSPFGEFQARRVLVQLCECRIRRCQMRSALGCLGVEQLGPPRHAMQMGPIFGAHCPEKPV